MPSTSSNVASSADVAAWLLPVTGSVDGVEPVVSDELGPLGEVGDDGAEGVEGCALDGGELSGGVRLPGVEGGTDEAGGGGELVGVEVSSGTVGELLDDDGAVVVDDDDGGVVVDVDVDGCASVVVVTRTVVGVGEPQVCPS